MVGRDVGRMSPSLPGLADSYITGGSPYSGNTVPTVFHLVWSQARVPLGPLAASGLRPGVLAHIVVTSPRYHRLPLRQEVPRSPTSATPLSGVSRRPVFVWVSDT